VTAATAVQPRQVDHFKTKRLQAWPSASLSDCDRTYPKRSDVAKALAEQLPTAVRTAELQKPQGG
jgi:hypothetical protein